MIVITIPRVIGADEYRIYRKKSDGNVYHPLKVRLPKKAEMKVFDGQLEHSSYYQYRIEALDANGQIIQKMEVTGHTRIIEIVIRA